MAADLNDLVRAICPDFPEDKHVTSSRDACAWYKVYWATNTLVLPPMHYIRSSVLVLDKVVEAVAAFSKSEKGAPEYKWEASDLNLMEAHHPQDIINILRNLPDMARQHESILACDIETRKVEWEDNILLSIGFAYGPSHCVAIYNIPIPGARYDGPDIRPSEIDEVLKALHYVFNQTDITYVWHNGKFDCGRMKYMCNIDARIDEDTMLRHYCTINEKRGTHGLKDLGRLYLQAPAWDDELDKLKREYCKKNKIRLSDFMYDDIPTEILIPYMQRDCIATYRLNTLFKRLGRPEADFIYRKLVEASNVYMRVELAGIQLDMDYLEDLEYELDKELEAAEKQLDAIVSKIWDPMEYSAATGAKAKPNDTFNIKSPKQLKWLLTKALGYPVPSTDAATIEALLDDVAAGIIKSNQAKELLEAIGSVRKNSKYMETYVQGMRERVCRDMRIRGTFNLHGTETGRLSSSNPNMQNIPRDKRIKNLLVARPGCALLQLDYSQAELRVLAMLSRDPYLINVYVSGKDLHSAVATEMFGPNFDKEQRVMAKTINFGIAYGRGPGSIATTFKKSMSEARAIIAKWFKPMPYVKQWIEGRRAMAKRGEPCVTPFGRERHFIITDAELNHIQNEYINTPIQSIASDFTMLSLMHIHYYLQEHWKGKARIVSTVHDSIMLEVEDNPDYLKEIGNECVRIMAETPLQYVPDCPVPFVADAEVGYKWGDMHDMDPETGKALVKE